MLTSGTIIKATHPHVGWELPHAAPEGKYTISVKDVEIYYKEEEIYNNQRISPYWALESHGYRFSLVQLIKIGFPARINRGDGNVTIFANSDEEFSFYLSIEPTKFGNRRHYRRIY